MIPNFRPAVGPREAAAAARVLRPGAMAQGREVPAFEAEAARHLGVRGGVAVASGTSALTLALRALGAGPGKEVLIPAYGPATLVHAVRAAGAEPVLADVHWHDMNISSAQARRRLTHRTAAAVIVHSFGASAELEPLLNLGVPVVEDVSQAFGAEDYNRRKLGSFGAAAVASFRATGLFTTAGEGGMVLSNDRRVLDAARDLRETGALPATVLRMDARMTEVQAAVGRVQLRRLPSFLKDRRRHAAAYRRGLEGLPLDFPLDVFGRVYSRFVVKTDKGVTDEVLAAFVRRGVEARRPVARPLAWDVPGPAMPVAERVWRRALCLPLYPALSGADLRRCVSAVREIFR